MKQKDDKGKLIVALDVDTFDEARTLIDSLSDVVNIFKVGSQLFTACGPVIVRHILARGKEVFLDLKYHDIPNTVANAVKSATALGKLAHEVQSDRQTTIQPTEGIFMCTLHASGGEEMLKEAVAAAKQHAHDIGVAKPLLVGITVLTSEQKADNILPLVLERARLCQDSGLDGVVSSVQEAADVRRECGKDFVIVTPGIRPKGSDQGDQKRVASAQEAISNGSDYLVVGRPIIAAQYPLNAAKDILEEINQVKI